MRILMISPSYQPQPVACGVGDYSRALAHELVRQGDSVSVVCGAAHTGDGEGGVEIARRVGKWSLREAARLARSPELRDADVVNMQYTPPLYGKASGFRLLPILLALRRRPPIVVTFHSLTGADSASKLWALSMLRFASRAIAANEEVASMIRRRLPSLAGKVTEVPIGPSFPRAPLSAAAARELRAELSGGERGAPLICCFGLIYRGKGIETLFAALPALRAKRPGLRVVVAGRRPPESADYAGELERLAADLGIADAIVWTGEIGAERASTILQAVDLLALPFDRGVSLRRSTLVTGLSHGVAIVAPLCDVASPLLVDDVNIAAVAPRDAEALAARIDELLDDPAALERLRRGARQLGDQLAWPAIAAAARELFATVARR